LTGGVAEIVPENLLVQVSMCVLDSILVSKKGDKMPPELAKELLRIWKQDKLASREGLRLLFTAALSIDVEETKRYLSSAGFTTIAERLPEAVAP